MVELRKIFRRKFSFHFRVSFFLLTFLADPPSVFVKRTAANERNTRTRGFFESRGKEARREEDRARGKSYRRVPGY